VDFSPKTPEEQRARRDAVNARKAPGVRVNFDCRHHQRDCIGCADITDDRLATFLCDGGYCVPINAPGQGMTDLEREAAEWQRRHKRRA